MCETTSRSLLTLKPEKGAKSRGARAPLTAEKDKKLGRPLEPVEGGRPCPHVRISPV